MKRRNELSVLLRKLVFFCLPMASMRTKFLYRHKVLFKSLGDNILFQPRKFPDEPELISIGNNVMIASDVTFVTHDIFHFLYHNMGYDINQLRNCIQIGDNVAIGTRVIILPNVKIGSNVIIGAGSVITKNIPNNSVVVGNSRIVGTFDDLLKRREAARLPLNTDEIWEKFITESDFK